LLSQHTASIANGFLGDSEADFLSNKTRYLQDKIIAVYSTNNASPEDIDDSK
jgi:hypothetical protein